MPKDPNIEVIARGVFVRDSRVLVCRNVAGGYAYLPGGHVEFGEPAAHALAREFEEEAGVAARVGPLLLTTEQTFAGPKRAHHEVNLVFLVEHLAAADGSPAGEVRSAEPDIAFEFVELAALPQTDLRPAGIRAWLMADGEAGGPAWVSEPGLPIPGAPGH